MRAIALAVAFASAALLAQGRGGFQGPQGPQPTRAVPAPHFEYAGPVSAGRIAAAAAVAGKPGVYYAGAASGGVWKSSDGGTTWKPTFDKESSQAIGALAVSQSNPTVVWAGTGEGWAVRDMDMMGDGIYKSTDAGETWTNMGLKDTGRIGTIVVHPTNENVVLVCALGRGTGPQRERGVFRTEDGGKTWAHALFVNEDTGCSGLQMSQKEHQYAPHAHDSNRAESSAAQTGNWRLETGNWKPEAGSRKPQAGSRKPQAGSRKLEAGS
jgi:photosystem II stability/assembly factor-like uncharacterized protein